MIINYFTVHLSMKIYVFLSSKQAKILALMDEYAKYKFNYVEAC